MAGKNLIPAKKRNNAMKLEGISLYLENLLPGVAITAAILAFIPWQSNELGVVLEGILNVEFVLGAFLLAVAYMLGLISAIISRILVDNIVSRHVTRPVMLTIGKGSEYENIAKAFSLAKEGKWAEGWNKAYNVALTRACSQEGKTRVTRLREQGRLVRNLFFPLMLSSAAVSYHFNVGNVWLVAIVSGVISILLYSYAEYSTFEEALLWGLSTVKVERKTCRQEAKLQIRNIKRIKRQRAAR